MGNLLTRPISKIEHAIHILLVLFTGLIWLGIYLARILFYKSYVKSQKSSKDNVMEQVERLAGNYKTPSGIGTYTRRTFVSEEEAEDDDWYEYSEPYSFEIVGESYKRENLLSIIKNHDAFKDGEVMVEAVLQMEPDNKFDSTAVQVIVEGKPVGYVPSDVSFSVWEYLDDHNVSQLKVPARIGWDINNPEPAIGVRLDFNF